MDTNSNKPADGTAIGVIALVLLCAGWLVSVILGDGFEFHRMAFAMPLVAAGALCGLLEAWRTGRVVWKPALISGLLVVLYFGWRAISSPVWDLGRHDLLLVALVWLSIATVATCATSAKRTRILVGVFIIVFAGHLALGLYQRFGDHEFVLMRLARRTGEGVSGLFWHWNNLAAMLSILLPVFLGIALTSRKPGLRLGFGAMVAAGLLLAYYSRSRAGFAAIVVGLCAVTAVLLLVRSRSWSWSARLATWAGMALAGIGAAVVIFVVASKVTEQRDGGGDLRAALGKTSRLALAGMAFDQWMEAPLTGSGSQSFEYLLVKNWDDEVLWAGMGNPETVHNEYLQTLADYGLAGFLLILSFGLLVISRVVVGGDESDGDRRDGLWRGVKYGAVGGLAGAMAHAAVDFQLHILPIVLLLGIGVGTLLQSKTRGGTLPKALHVLAVLLAVVFAVMAGWRENAAIGSWLKWERHVIGSGGEITVEGLQTLKSLVEKSPNYEVAREYGRIFYQGYIAGDPRDPRYLEEARWAMEVAYKRHPYDQEIVGNYALVLDLLEDWDKATGIHLQAVELSANRERKYGAMAAFSLHLYQKGELVWNKRKPDLALGYYLRAEDYLVASRAKLFKMPRGEFEKRKRLLADRITLLQGAGIEVRFPADIPPPPRDP